MDAYSLPKKGVAFVLVMIVLTGQLRKVRNFLSKLRVFLAHSLVELLQLYLRERERESEKQSLTEKTDHQTVTCREN